MNSIIWRSRHAIAAKWNHAVEAAHSAESLLKNTAIEYGCGLQLCLFTFISPSLWVCVCDWFIFGPSSAVMCCESWGFRELKKMRNFLKGNFGCVCTCASLSACCVLFLSCSISCEAVWVFMSLPVFLCRTLRYCLIFESGRVWSRCSAYFFF